MNVYFLFNGNEQVLHSNVLFCGFTVKKSLHYYLIFVYISEILTADRMVSSSIKAIFALKNWCLGVYIPMIVLVIDMKYLLDFDERLLCAYEPTSINTPVNYFTKQCWADGNLKDANGNRPYVTLDSLCI